MVSFLARVPVPLADISFCWQGGTSFPDICTIWCITAAFTMKESLSAFQTIFIRVTHHWSESRAELKHGHRSAVTGICSISDKLGPFCKISLVTGGQVLSMDKLLVWLCLCLQSCCDFYPQENCFCLSTFHSLKPWLYKSHFCLVPHFVNFVAAVRGSVQYCPEGTPALPLPGPRLCCSLISPSFCRAINCSQCRPYTLLTSGQREEKSSLILGISL